MQYWGGICTNESSKEVTLFGHISHKNHQLLELNIVECKAEDLPEGEVCMEETELADYYQSMVMFVSATNNFIDYENIADPIRQEFKGAGFFSVNLNTFESNLVTFERIQFFDTTTRVQLFDEPT